MAWTTRDRPTVDSAYWVDEDDGYILDEDGGALLFDIDDTEGSNWIDRRALEQ